MSDSSSPQSHDENMFHSRSNENERALLTNVQVATVPQETFEKADDYYVRASKLDDEAIELADKLEELKNSAEDFRTTAFDLRRLATHDRAQIEAELDGILSKNAAILPLYKSKPKRARKLERMIADVEEGLVMPNKVSDFGKKLSTFYEAQTAKTRTDTSTMIPILLHGFDTKPSRASTSSDDSCGNVKIVKRLKLHGSNPIVVQPDSPSIAATCSAEEADKEVESDNESILLGSPFKDNYLDVVRKSTSHALHPEALRLPIQTPAFLPKPSKTAKQNKSQQQPQGQSNDPQAIDEGTTLTNNDGTAQTSRKRKRQRRRENRRTESNLTEIVPEAFADTERKSNLKARKEKLYDL